MNLDQEIMRDADELKDSMIVRRRTLHRYPETGWTEFHTAALVAETLDSYGYEIATGEDAVARGSMMGLPAPEVLRAAEERAVAEGAPPRWLARMKGGLTGVVATLRFERPGPVVALRFDMDSNDVDETDAPFHLPNREGFASRHAGGASRINVGVLEAGTGRNVTADKALLQFETRGATSAINEFMETEAKRVLEAAAAMYGVEVSIEKVGGAAGGASSPKLAAYVAKRAKELGIFSKTVETCDFGASDDCTYFMERVESRGGEAAYLMIGADLAAGHHDSRFDFDENALPNAAKILACTAAGLLTGERP